MTAFPAVEPVTIPDVNPTGATAVVPLVQTPPGVALVRVVVVPAHRSRVPTIASGSGFTMTTIVRLQLAADV